MLTLFCSRAKPDNGKEALCREVRRLNALLVTRRCQFEKCLDSMAERNAALARENLVLKLALQGIKE